MTPLRLAERHATAACAALIPAAAGGKDSHGGKLDVEELTKRALRELKRAVEILEKGAK